MQPSSTMSTGSRELIIDFLSGHGNRACAPLNSHISNFLAAPLLLLSSCLNANIPKENLSSSKFLLQYTERSLTICCIGADNGCG